MENSAFISYEGVFANYSDYIRFDGRTGEALIDKELLEQARINDEVKKNIEELVKTYNENASKVRQIEDELIKAENKKNLRWNRFTKSFIQRINCGFAYFIGRIY